MRNKPFPHFEELSVPFGKDRANGARAETAADAVEEIDREEQQGGNGDGANDVEGGMEDIDGSGSVSGTPTSSVPNKKNSGKKRSRSNDGLMESLIDELASFGRIYEGTRENVRRIANYFEKRAEGDERRMKLFGEIMEIEDLSSNDMLTAGEVISKDSHKIDFFFTLPPPFKKQYVMKVVSENSTYHPQYDFNV